MLMFFDASAFNYIGIYKSRRVPFDTYFNSDLAAAISPLGEDRVVATGENDGSKRNDQTYVPHTPVI